MELALQHHPDLILLDVQLLNLMGDEVLRRLQANPRCKDIPVIILSFDAGESRIEQMIVAGATAYLTKPLDINEFLRVFDLTCENNSSLHHNQMENETHF